MPRYPLDGAGAATSRSQYFTSNGTWTRPAGVTLVWITLWGGGANGGGTNQAAFSTGGGGAGEIIYHKPVTVSTDVNVVIGAGGTGDIGDRGNPGEDSTFGGETAKGGRGGHSACDSTISSGGGVLGAEGPALGVDGARGSDALYILGGSSGGGGGLAGGTGGTGGDSIQYHGGTKVANGGGGGGAGFNGNGGAGGANNGAGSNAGANSGAGGGGNGGSGTEGGNGGSGGCIVEWVE